MKTFISTVFVLLMVSGYSQLKPHVGMTIPTLTAPPLGRDFEPKNGFIAGIAYQFGGKFYVEPGLQYATYGYNFARTIDPDLYYTYDVSSIRIPVMFGGKLMGDDAAFQLRAFVGPSVTVAFGEEIEALGDFEIDKRNLFLLGWTIGYGVDYWKLYFEIGYDFGLSNYFEDHDFDTRNAKQNMLWLTIGANLFE